MSQQEVLEDLWRTCASRPEKAEQERFEIERQYNQVVHDLELYRERVRDLTALMIRWKRVVDYLQHRKGCPAVALRDDRCTCGLREAFLQVADASGL